jgi:diadenosine tetraphosphate (Ap4A) HIT family hydrolase
MKNQHVDLDNARVDEQRQVMQEIIDADHCPFCSENLAKYHTQPILKEGKFWLVTTNQWPYTFTKLHLLFIHKNHITTLQEMDPAAGKELIELAQWAEAAYQVPGGGLAMRFGDTDYSAGTVAHLHAQFLVPDIEAEGYEPVRIKIGKKR